MTGLNWLKNQRRQSTKSPRNPAVIARSRAPNGRRALGDTDGNTTRTRSKKIATRPNSEATTSGVCRWGGRPVRRLHRYTNGISQPTTSTNHASVSHGWVKKRVAKKRVSMGTFPYQITRYWDQKKYIHMIDIANERRHERQRRDKERCRAGERPQPKEGHVQPRLLRDHRRRHPRVERRLAREEHEEQDEGCRQEARRRQRDPPDARRPPRLRELHHGGDGGTGHGEPRPEHQVHQVDRPHRPGISRARAREKGDGSGRRDETPEDGHFCARVRRELTMGHAPAGGSASPHRRRTAPRAN